MRLGWRSWSSAKTSPSTENTQRHQATVKPGQVPSEPHRATPSDTQKVTGGQGVAGSNPAVPTGSQVFSKIFTPRKSQQKSHSLVNGPSSGAPIVRHGVLIRAFAIRQSRRRPQSSGQRSLSHLGSARQPPQLRTRRHHPRRTGPPPAGRSLGRRSCGTQAGPDHPRQASHATSDAMAAGMRTAFGRTATTVATLRRWLSSPG